MSVARPKRNPALAAAGLLLLAALLFSHGPAAGQASAAPTASAAGKTTLVTNTFRMTRPDQKTRFTVGCPRNKFPLGGGMIANPPPGRDGEGVYPHSYERLGVQHGYHVTAVLFDPSHGSTQPRDVTLQVVCSRKQEHVTPPHTTVQVNPGQTKTAVATCPGRRHLFGGGFQRTDFVSRGGDFMTDSHAISSKSWSVTGHAFGGFGGELTAIAYCWRSKKPLLKEVSASTTVASGTYGTATTPPCPGGKRLVFGGFGSSPTASTFLADGHVNPDQSWSASGFNYFGPPATLTAYGYCLKVKV